MLTVGRKPASSGKSRLQHTRLDTAGSRYVCSDLVSYKDREELLNDVTHIKELQKYCCFYSKCFMLEQENKDLQLLTFGKAGRASENAMNHSQRAGKLTDCTSSLPSSMVSTVQRVPPKVHGVCLMVVLNASISALLSS